jgi:hypothetical protein
VNNRNNQWNQWKQNNQVNINNFQNNQAQRWNNLSDSAAWRTANREDWQNHREEMWDYRADRANDVWDHAQDFYDDVFDDHWWGGWGYGAGYYHGSHAANPWWWWAPAAVATTAAVVDGLVSDPVYVDYGTQVIYEGSTTYVNNQPQPTAQYVQPAREMATTVVQPPPPLPPEQGKPAEWLPLGVYALAQEEKGDPIMFFQISINKDGLISGAFTSTLTNDERPVAGQIDKKTQAVAWRIGENKETVFSTTLGNLSLDVSPITIVFGQDRTQTWLMVRMPEPAPAGKEGKIPEVNRKPPPLKDAPKTASL